MKTQKEGVGWESFWVGGHVALRESGALEKEWKLLTLSPACALLVIGIFLGYTLS